MTKLADQPWEPAQVWDEDGSLGFTPGRTYRQELEARFVEAWIGALDAIVGKRLLGEAVEEAHELGQMQADLLLKAWEEERDV